MRMRSAAVVLFTVFIKFTEARYSTSFVYITARNTQSGQETQVCANYLQFRQQLIAVTAKQAKPVEMVWWRGEYNQTHICPLPPRNEDPFKYNGKAVPIDYRIENDGTPCTQPFTEVRSSFRNASQFEVDVLKIYGAEIAILLIEKGRRFVTRWHDYLFSDFYDPYINVTTAIPTFFLYKEVFQEKIMGIVNGNEKLLQLRFHRPLSKSFDFSMVIIWLLAMGCVTGGGVWAFIRHRAGKDKDKLPLTQSMGVRSNNSGSFNGTVSNIDHEQQGFFVRYANCFAIVVLMFILVGILMLGFFFRPLLVMFFNVLLVGFGSISVYGCFHALLSNFKYSGPKLCSSVICSKFPELGCISHKPTLSNVVKYFISLAICIFWFIFRKAPYAFILLDFINITLCLHILKSLRLPSLRWISSLMVCMFIYDAVMVFVTPLWTKNGCSVMLEVATGIDCSSPTAIGYPMPPIDASLPERFPMLMQVMHFDPMLKCFDLDVERGFQMTILGLGDIIIPGYLITHCFTMSGFSEKTRIIYGVVCTIGYGLGLIATFIALTLMKMAQPALIYLVPFTLLPICFLACARNEFQCIWYGVPEKFATPKASTNEESGPLSGVTEETDMPTQIQINIPS